MTDALSPATLLALDEAFERDATRGGFARSGTIAVIGDDALATAVLERFNASVRLFDEHTPVDVAAPAGCERQGLVAELVTEVTLVIGELPQTLAGVDEIAGLAARFADPDVLVVLAAREKDLERGMNDRLRASFVEVSASRGRGKARALIASGPRPVPSPAYPRSELVSGLEFPIAAHGAVFAGTRLDIGTRALLDVLGDELDSAVLPERPTVVDLGCGTGILAVWAARHLADARVIATDRSWSAVSSTSRTAELAGVADRVETVHTDAGEGIPDRSVDVVLLNPPFHDGRAVIDDMAQPLFRAAGRMLRSGGTLLTVYNSHLRHRGALERTVGPTSQVSRTPKFTVTRSIAR
ncbi:class I SAM-dependent methyltransferase [Microbacterium sp. ZW T5_56]|uniref:class I SAM-dependent methyltransferase n=1 Tax=Microbacterium sp. ZW T5_56 TaxID=3378081 RepID=UPI0038532C8A